LRGAALHHVRVRFADGGDSGWVAALPGVRDVRDADGELHFDVGGPLDPVVKALAERTVADLEVTIPSLEETFLAFYEGRS
jgi:ABC-2 type transport system ATP-binding protein